MMLNANWVGSWWTYCPRFSNHSRLACAARWVESTTGFRSASYVASAASVVDLLVQARREGERVLHRELGAGADREVRGVGGVAEEHDALAGLA